jgi:hypothetical protein
MSGIFGAPQGTGAAVGTGVGAGVGSMFPVVGTIGGAMIGGAAGSLADMIFGGDEDVPAPQINFNQDPNAYVNPHAEEDRRALQLALLAQQNNNAAENNPFRQHQLALAQALQAQSEGKGPPSLAEMQMQRGSERNILNNQAMMASAPNVNAGLAARLLGQNTAQAQQQNVADTSMLRAQEQYAARGALGNLVGQGRQGDIGAQTLHQDLIKYYQQALLDQAERDRGAQMNRQALAAQMAAAQAGINLQAGGQNAAYANQRNSNLMQGIGSAATLMAMNGMGGGGGGEGAPSRLDYLYGRPNTNLSLGAAPISNGSGLMLGR